MNSIADQIFTTPADWQGRVLYSDCHGQTTYGQTRAAMLQIAGWLADNHGVEAGQRVAVCLPMGIAFVHIVLGIVAAGACYVPLQHNGPTDRMRETLGRFSADCLITTELVAQKLAPLMASDALKIMVVDPAGSRLADGLATCIPRSRPEPVDPDAMAGVFFTSGSTGQPKGIVMSYRSMVMAGSVLPRSIGFTGDDRMIMSAPSHYAASLEFLHPLWAGGRMYIASEEEALFATEMADTIEREQITVWCGAAGRLRLLIDDGKLANRNLDAMRFVAFYGERTSAGTLLAGQKYFPNARFQNSFDASECHWIMGYDVPRPLPADMESLPIGKPRPSYTVALCDEGGVEVAAGEVGEICAIGPVALISYWQQPEETAAVRLNGRADSYRTGDLARLGADGNYHLVGRQDHQVKIRGHRFELGEIETVLKSHDGVRDAVALLVGDAIMAFVLAQHSDSLVAEVRSICTRRLPVFARPAQVIVVDRFPYLSSGKVDRQGLRHELAKRGQS